jgi:Dihaem cytochrome c
MIRSILPLASALAFVAEASLAANMQYVPAGAGMEAERECGACHTFIPPQEEPMQEWRDILRNLSNHMGEDATLPEPLRADIEAYLVAHASDGPEYRPPYAR